MEGRLELFFTPVVFGFLKTALLLITAMTGLAFCLGAVIDGVAMVARGILPVAIPLSLCLAVYFVGDRFYRARFVVEQGAGYIVFERAVLGRRSTVFALSYPETASLRIEKVSYQSVLISLDSYHLAAVPEDGNRLIISNSNLLTLEEVQEIGFEAASIIGCPLEREVHSPSFFEAMICSILDVRWI